LLTARCTPELERVQAELGARISFRHAACTHAACTLDTLLPASPATHGSRRTRTHAVALRLEAVFGHAWTDVERLRRLLWNGNHKKACEALGWIASWAKRAPET